MPIFQDLTPFVAALGGDNKPSQAHLSPDTIFNDKFVEDLSVDIEFHCLIF